MTTISRLIGMVAVVVVVAAGGLAGTARAQGGATVSCDILEISATSGDKPSIDADLKPLEKKLKKKLFAAWNTFKLLSRTSKDLTQGKPETTTLTKGKATVLFRETDTSGKKVRIALTLTTEDEKGKRLADTKVNIDSGDYIVIGRTLANDDGHLLALTCKP
jgi:hypothetical protein